MQADFPAANTDMKQAIAGYHTDDEGDWVAELACGHFQHVRHNPPWINRPWVVSESGRNAKRGQLLECKKCDAGAPPDQQASNAPSADARRGTST